MTSWLDIPALNTALLIGLFGAVLRWGWQTTKVLTVLAQRLEAHERIDDLRFAESSRRLEDLEEARPWRRPS